MTTQTMSAPATLNSTALLDLRRYEVLLGALRETCETLTTAGDGDLETHTSLAAQYLTLRSRVMAVLPGDDALHVQEWAPDLSGQGASPAGVYAASSMLAACITSVLDGPAWLASFHARQVRIAALTAESELERDVREAASAPPGPGQYL